MTEAPAFRRFARIAQKWRHLVERRCSQFIELHRTGGWKCHYTEAQFLLLMREAVAMAETWARIAPRPEDVSGEAAAAKVEAVAEPARPRTAA
jgi:glycine/D-amino acid oxidase-like deaminating enzyme